jgi:competence protein ComEA
MDRFGEWRPIAPAAKADADEQSPATPARPADSADGPEANASSVRLFGLLGAGVLAAVGAAIWLTNPGSDSEARLDVAAAAGYFSVATPGLGAVGGARFSAAPIDLVIDIQGAVIRPGVHRLAAGSRVGDAIDAAGGYSAQVDLAAASATLNLAAPLTDGAKIHVPARGEVVTSTPAGGGTGGSGTAGGPINVNTATAEELDTLPGIGPVTAAKIIAAREQAPFATVDELLSRDVLGPATLEKIRALVIVAP